MPKKVSSYVKGLVETRARAAGDLERLRRIHAELSARIATAEADIAACDRLIRKFDGRLDPSLIEPLHTRSYGGRGRLRAAVLDQLQLAYPGEVTTSELAVEMQIKFGFDFLTATQRDNWVRGSLARALRDLHAEGLAERMHDPMLRTGEPGRWRLRPASAPSTSDLLAQLSAQGEELAIEPESVEPSAAVRGHTHPMLPRSDGRSNRQVSAQPRPTPYEP